MNSHNTYLPQLDGKFFITDGGLETELVFHEKIELPEFAAYDLLRNESGYETLFEYYKKYALLAQQYKVGLILETPTWRANTDWGKKIGDSLDALNQLNVKAVELIKHIRSEYSNENTPIIISGCLGPRGDGYTPSNTMSAQQARDYHTGQINTLVDAGVDMVAALTLNYAGEAIGITQAAQSNNIPICISFTLETDAKLPTGESLQEVIEAVDAATGNGPAYYMINCAHPTHFEHLFTHVEPWTQRIKGVRCNASCLSHAELDEAEVLDEGNPDEFGRQIAALKLQSNQLNVLGGCCGTDIRHIKQICQNLK